LIAFIIIPQFFICFESESTTIDLEEGTFSATFFRMTFTCTKCTNVYYAENYADEIKAISYNIEHTPEDSKVKALV